MPLVKNMFPNSLQYDSQLSGHSLSHGEEIGGPSPSPRVKRQKIANLVHHACMLVCLALACGRSAAAEAT